ncbi:flagellin [Alphaproteobacteria bacterium]|nr:flagellin [Alphaproteobacteria bacterium]
MTMINTNVGALLARTYATLAAERMQTAMERLSSGKRINNAADDAAGLAVANKMQSQLGGIKMAVRNSQDGISVAQTADGALGEISKLIRRMRELAVQMQNGIYTAQDRSNAQMEVRALLAEINKITSNTQYNKVNLLDGTYDQTIRAGNTNAETIRLSIGSAATSETAKIVNFAVEKAIGHTSTSPSRANTQNELEVFEATTVEVDTSVWSTTFATSFNTDSLGTFTFSGGAGDNGDFDLDPRTGKLTSKAAIVSGVGGSGNSPADTPGADNIGTAAVTNGQFQVQVTYTHRDGVTTHVETLQINVKDKSETTLDDLKVETTADAGRAVETLDKALEEVSTAQAKLGAVQNRLTHNIDNLSKSSMLTEQSVGRIMDADYAAETAELSKQQILSQAATSMLAQANVSKQGVIALLR